MPHTLRDLAEQPVVGAVDDFQVADAQLLLMAVRDKRVVSLQ